MTRYLPLLKLLKRGRFQAAIRVAIRVFKVHSVNGRNRGKAVLCAIASEALRRATNIRSPLTVGA